MKKLFIAFVMISSLFLCSFSSLNDTGETANKNNTVDEFVNDLLSKMTLEEKVGQMTQLTVEVISQRRLGGKAPLQLDMEKTREAIVKYHIGSIINTGGFANSLENWYEVITNIQDISTKETRLGIPNLYGIDAIHGVNYTSGATLFPQSIAMAATRNRVLLEKSASITAFEMRASGIPWNFNPVLGMGREPLWPRFWETFGEDVYLVSEFAREYVNGIQGNDASAPDKGAACMKHYLGYSVPKTGQDRTPTWIPERMLREIFLPSFQSAVDAGVLTVMINSGEINGIPTHSDKFVLTDLLKGELKFKGFAVSDWEDIKRLYDRDFVASSPKEAVKMAVMAGVDMSMVPYDFSFYTLLVELVKDGEVPMERIDDAVSRILRVKYLTSLFDNAYPNKELANGFASPEFTNTNLEAAREAITLLKNDDSTLPLKKDAKILVTGPTANKMSLLNGGWTITWLGNEEALYPQEKNTIYEAIVAKAGKDNVQFVEGVGIDKDINSAEAVEAAAKADVIVLCLGEPTYCETNGNIKNLELYPEQLKFAVEMYATGKPVVLVMVEGRPRIINSIVSGAKSILMAYLPGMEGGTAIADILFGDVNPSGKLPFSYPKFVNGHTPYDFKPLENLNGNTVEPQWTFGHGLSYTNFEYSNLKIDKAAYSMDEVINISVEVKNSGSVAGKEAVELYVRDIYGSVSRPVKQLKGFEKINLNPGESRVVNFKLDKNSLSFINRENKRVTEPGEFWVMVQNLKQTISLNQ